MTKTYYIFVPASMVCIFLSLLNWLMCNDTASGWWGFFGIAIMYIASQCARED